MNARDIAVIVGATVLLFALWRITRRLEIIDRRLGRICDYLFQQYLQRRPRKNPPPFPEE
jgi:hypothetical protein